MPIRLGSILLLLLTLLYSSFALANPPAESSPMPLSPEIIPQTDILIDVGHGGIDGGTSYKELLEKNLNLELARKLFQELTERNYRVVINRTGDYALSEDNGWKKLRSRHRRDLVQRKEIVNQLKPSVMVSLHVNWASSPSESGGVVLYQNNPESKALAKAIQLSLNDLYEQDHAPVYGKTFFLLKHSKVPSVIVEMGFISSPQDRKRLTEEPLQKELARSIADGIVQYLQTTDDSSPSTE
ncbi:N-acetylmuramoyl-L-alanine amidase family protein [Paenibacillus senegalensis]|uniref:N-acetylmuramoyl-L-alanine amidase family protein n=1 Tax=Paenibacillus senegalensis TaxID=1465766 RepID=UPI0002889B2E|nr:N-acetylmuramoyl-L-alanine amidase [Paenibacillus senegalensis]